MIARQLLLGILIILAIVFLGFQIVGLEVVAAGFRALLFVFLTTFYWIKVKEKQPLFLAFLMTFTIADMLSFYGSMSPAVPPNDIDFAYYFINSLYIMAYTFLILKTVATLNFKEVIRKYPFHLLILIILDVFSVIVITNTTLEKLNFAEYSLELVYNSVIMILLTATLINFIHTNSKKAVNLMMGSIFIFFSEIIQLAYFYVADMNLLNIFCSIFLLLAFLFFILQSTLSYREPDKVYL